MEDGTTADLADASRWAQPVARLEITDQQASHTATRERDVESYFMQGVESGETPVLQIHKSPTSLVMSLPITSPISSNELTSPTSSDPMSTISISRLSGGLEHPRRPKVPYSIEQSDPPAAYREYPKPRATDHSEDYDRAPREDVLTPDLQQWQQLPLNKSDAVSVSLSPWLANSDMVNACPELPEPLDLLYGTNNNPLADMIQNALRALRCRDPERLGIGWLLYVMAKWRATPTAERFARIPVFFRPVQRQLTELHASCIDTIIWSGLRLNLMDNIDELDIWEITGMLSCCLKIRWPWGQDFLERDEDNVLRIRVDFMRTFTSETGWGITSEFVMRYPALFRDMDLTTVCYTPS